MAKRQKPPTLSPEERVKSFEEVKGTYLPHQAIAEAARCLFCHDAPCNKECPAGIDIVKFIRRIKTKDFRSAIRTIRESNVLAGVCARVCPTEELCEKPCSATELVESINIGDLQRFVTDLEMREGIKLPKKAAPTGKKVAVIGSGPAGLAAAAELAKAGHGVIIFETKSLPGGMLTYGIPPYRLPKDVVTAEVDFIKQLGVEIRTDTPLDEKLNIDTLFGQGFDAIFIGAGLGRSSSVGMPEEDIKGVYSALEFLSQVNLYQLEGKKEFPMRIGKRVVVIGGGNAAMDCARSILRMGSSVTVIYRRSRKEMPATSEEVEEALDEGVEIQFLTAPKALVTYEGKVVGIECFKMRLGEPDASDRRRPIPIEGSDFKLDAETVIEAIGQSPDPSLSPILSGVKTERGLILIDQETYMTSREGVFAGGDIVNGGDTVVQAIGEGKKAAEGINNYLKSSVKEKR